MQRLLPISATADSGFGINGFPSRNQPLHKRATEDSHIGFVRLLKKGIIYLRYAMNRDDF